MKTETEKDDSGRSSQASGSAAAHRMQIAQMERAGVALTLYPGGQAEAIARHYVAMANTARDLLALLEARDGYGRRLSETDAVVAFLVGEIKERHANDFGIPLEWPNDKLTARVSGRTPMSKETPREPVAGAATGYAMGISRDRRHVIVKHFNNFATRDDGRKVYTHQFAKMAYAAQVELLCDNIKPARLECRREDWLEFIAHNYCNSTPVDSQITAILGIPVVFDHRIPAGELHMVAESHNDKVSGRLAETNKEETTNE